MKQQDRGLFATRTLATIGVAALALAGVVVGSTAASAAAPGNIDPEETGSIKVHKYVENGSTDPLSGPDTSVSGTGLEGVIFDLYLLPNLSVLDVDDWDVFNTLSYDAATHTVTGTGYSEALGAATESEETGADGTWLFDSLDLGVYLIVEGNDNGGNNITSKAAPFFVTIPLPDNEAWLYDVNVYPKNSITTIDKTVTSPTTYGLGSTVTWPITVNIPVLAPEANFTSFVISDVLDERLAYESHTLTVNGTPLVGATVVLPSAANSNTFTATLVGGDTNLNTLLQDNAGEDIVLTLTTSVIGVGAIVNDLANVNINGVDFGTPEPVTRWGDLVIQKTDRLDPANPLAGAEFQVYFGQCVFTDSAVDLTGKTPVSVTSVDPPGTTSTFVTPDSGQVTVAGLWVGDSSSTENNVSVRDYCVVETAAPSGYNILAPGAWTVSVTAGATQGIDVTVADPKKPPVELPLTGSSGTAMFVVGGSALILLASGILLAAIRRPRSTETR